MVRAWRETVTIPTYQAGAPEKNPVFLEKRVYQGSSGAVYPYPVIESISDTKVDHEYKAVFLENEYIKVMILPELGGRVQMAYDKIAKRHFIYYNRVIKPALVGLAGPWISGGIEFNWPQHHRPSTFMPVDCTIEDNPDGSVTVWCSEMERMFHQKGMAGFTLRPGHAYLDIKGILYNRTDMPQTFLWWANPAVKVNDAYRSVFPPDVNAVFDHGKRAVSTFPIATGTYYKMDYSAGVDISNYKNIHVPTSYMVAHSDYDFEGGYEDDTRCGMLHVANHRFAPGKKQWTWGNGDFGRAWDRNLTDEDGPYIELMAGVYTENQPDFSWIMPCEEKSFVQYFFPYRELGIVKNASKDLVMNMEPSANDGVRLLAFATSRQSTHIELRTNSGEVLFVEDALLSPETVYDKVIELHGAAYDSLVFRIGRLSCKAVEGQGPVPPAAEAALKPSETGTCEQLYLTGLHLEQYRHATWDPSAYYEEALRRDHDDVRNNNALGLWYMRKGRFELAEPLFRTAVKVLQRRNPNPYDGEPLYNLGLCLRYQGKLYEAYDFFYKSTWNAAWQDPGYFACAQISTSQGRYDDALDELDHALGRNWHNHKARALKVAVLHRLGRDEEASVLVAESLMLDKFNYGVRMVQVLIDGSGLEELVGLMRGEPENYDEIALDFCAAGLTEEAEAIWVLGERNHALSAMSAYYRRHYCGTVSLQDKSGRICFPNRLEAIAALSDADPSDAFAPYLLGNLWYDKRQYDLAAEAWEKSAKLNPSFPTVWRNLALVRYNKQHDAATALEAMERAFALDETDARVLMELDQLYKKLRRPAADRLAFLEDHTCQVQSRDDLVLEEITLLNTLDRYEDAMKKIAGRIFHPWEGGEGKVPEQYRRCRVELAKKAIGDCRYDDAVRLLGECLVYPHNLGEGKLYCAQEQDIYYHLGCALSGSGDLEGARQAWEKASEGDLKPAPALYYNDARPENIYYQGLALLDLGRSEEALAKFKMLIDYGRRHLDDEVVMDYFAVSLPDLAIWNEDLKARNVTHCNLMIELGEEGINKINDK